MRTAVLVFILFMCVTMKDLFAQPVLTGAANNYVLGDYFEFAISPYFSEGPSGANQTWNFSAADSGGYETYKVMDPDSVPGPGNYCNAQLAILRTGPYTLYYYWNTSSALSEWTGTFWLGVQYNYSDKQTKFIFPFSFGDSFTDTQAYTWTSNGVTYHSRGSVTRTADGYGTLITPSGTFVNVLRVHSNEIYIDSSAATGDVDTTVYNVYEWWQPGVHASLVTTGVFTGASTGSFSGYLVNPVITAVLPAEITSPQVYPNPSDDFVFVSTGEASVNLNDVMVYSCDGKSVAAGISIDSENRLKIDIKNLSEGVYIVRIKTASGTAAKRVLVAR